MYKAQHDQTALGDDPALDRSRIAALRGPALLLDEQLRVSWANRAFHRTFGLAKGETEGRLVFELGNGQWDLPALHTMLDEILATNAVIDDLEIPHDFEGFGRRILVVNARKVTLDGEKILLRIEDVAELRRAREAILRARDRLGGILSSADLAAWTWDFETGRNDAGPSLVLGVGEIAGGSPDVDLARMHPDDGPRVEAALVRCRDEGAAFDEDYRVSRPDGTHRWMSARGRVRFDANGSPLSLDGVTIDITARKRQELLLEWHKHILELVAQNASLPGVLNALCRMTEEQSEGGMLASILLLDRDGLHLRHGAAPSLPEAYNRVIDGVAIGPEVGSCGTAAYRREPVFVEDIATDPLWADYASLALSHGLRACWSQPIFSREGEVLGTFAMYYRHPRRPEPADLRLTDIVTRTAAIAIDRTRVEQALRENEQRFRFLSELDEATAGLQDPGRVMAETSRMLGEHLGASRCAYAEVEADGDRFRIRHDYAVKGSASTVGDYRLTFFGARAVDDLRGGQTLVIRDVAGELTRTDGSEMFASIGINAIICCPLVKEGRLTAMIAVHQDEVRAWTPDEVVLVEAVAARSWAYIERARADRNLLESEARLRAIVDSTPECVKLVSADGLLLEMNAAGLNMVEVDGAEEVIGRCVYDVIAPEHRESFQAFNERVCRGQAGSLEFDIIGLRGSRRNMETHAVPLRDGQGRVTHLAVTRDISARKRDEAERERLLAEAQRARGEAEAANRMKDEFLATLSHELRTPLNAIMGWSKLLRLGQVDPEDLEEGLAAIERNSVAQAQIIEDLLDVSRIVSGNFRLEIQPVDLRETIEAALATVMPAASVKEIRFRRVLDSLAGPIMGDPARLQQIVWNLLSNAVKFTPRGGQVQLFLERVDSQIEIRIIDSGLGIRPEFLPHVFDRFRQADSSTTRKYGGLGLGLAIVKQLVEMHGGTVRALSPGEGQGATFIVTLPILVGLPDRPALEEERRIEAVAPEEPFQAGPLDGLKVLILDDEPDARRLIHRVLTACRAEVAAASTVREALELVERFRPDVIVSDVGMPEQDGYDFIRQVRTRHPAKDLPAAALTAFARAEDRKRALLAGFQTHVAKPVDPAELVAVVASLAGRTGIA